MWYGTLVTTMPGWNSSAALSRSAVWLWSRCSHQCDGTNSGQDNGDRVVAGACL